MRVGSYEIERKIGQGGFGYTYLGRHTTLNEPVCIKQERTRKEPFHSMFVREAKLLWHVHHISLPTMKDYIDDPTHGALLVMSFIEGMDLEQFVATQGPLDDEHVCWILLRLLDALGYLHYRGVIHSDVKPANIILRPEEHNAVLVDFGLVVAKPGATSRALGGTRHYAPPEYMLGLPPIPASDLYALGKTAVHMVGGDPATGALPSGITHDLRELMVWLTRHDSLARPQSAREAADAVATLRKHAFGRTTTRECLKLRNGKVWS